MKRVFVSESITSGAWADRPLEGSLAREGQAMLVALAEDLAQDPQTRMVTSWDSRLGKFPVDETEVVEVENTEQADETFGRLAASSDRTLVIAPEIDRLLEQRCRMVHEANGSWVGCSADTIALCSDKLQTTEHLQLHGLPVVDTRTADQPRPDSPQVVWKPRHGAGSIGISTTPRNAPPPGPDHVVQPLVSGRPVSVAVICSDECHIALPVATQHLSQDGHFNYQGGRVPCLDYDSPESQSVRSLALAACNSLEQPIGWIGIDLMLLPDHSVLIMEINPRLTTSFLGYRQLTPRLPLGQVVASPETAAATNWDWCYTRVDPIEFTSTGTVIGRNPSLPCS